jgi:hypothetical protein
MSVPAHPKNSPHSKIRRWEIKQERTMKKIAMFVLLLATYPAFAQGAKESEAARNQFARGYRIVLLDHGFHGSNVWADGQQLTISFASADDAWAVQMHKQFIVPQQVPLRKLGFSSVVLQDADGYHHAWDLNKTN